VSPRKEVGGPEPGDAAADDCYFHKLEIMDGTVIRSLANAGSQPLEETP
jgi:hypothetical protein